MSNEELIEQLKNAGDALANHIVDVGEDIYDGDTAIKGWEEVRQHLFPEYNRRRGV